MTQTIQVTATLPDDQVIVSKVWLQDLIDNQPINMTLAEVAATYPTTKQWIVENIINDDYFRRKIAPFSQFVNPDGKGKYLFNRKKMRKFLQDYDEEIKARANRNF
ncbi:DUF771 domain-containing protein [Staphylococcus saprophyticus]|uniref:DUF771 domain-containing protein n=1 Tax=Staphylococcus saprophyticus TaxID=29385 RepID=UPI0022EA2F32|nr:DUF771 domain-containing protein [Staphylococcus saprophyticus]